MTTVPPPYCVEQVVPQAIPAGLLTTIPSPSPALVTVSALGGLMNVAVTDLSASIVSTQGAVPVQSSDQPVNTSPAAGEAVSVTCAESSNVAEQVVVQTMPPGWIVTEPVPPPVRETVKVRSRTKVAVTDRPEFIVNVHEPGPVPEQAVSPDQPSNRLPGDGIADRVTTVPWSKPAEHVEPQSIPAGVLVTVPAPLPAFVTLRTGVNVAVRKWFWSIVSVQGPVPEQAGSPDQPSNRLLGSAVAVSVTWLPASNTAWHVVPQSIPGWTSLTTVPAPPPAGVTVTARCRTNVAVTAWSDVIDTVHGSLVQSPDHPAKRLPGSGVAVSVTWVPSSNAASHVVPQSIPGGTLATVPAPPPSLETIRFQVAVGASDPPLPGPALTSAATIRAPRATPNVSTTRRERLLICRPHMPGLCTPSPRVIGSRALLSRAVDRGLQR
jgi:hypothetical protein